MKRFERGTIVAETFLSEPSGSWKGKECVTITDKYYRDAVTLSLDLLEEILVNLKKEG